MDPALAQSHSSTHRGDTAMPVAVFHDHFKEGRAALQYSSPKPANSGKPCCISRTCRIGSGHGPLVVSHSPAGLRRTDRLHAWSAIGDWTGSSCGDKRPRYGRASREQNRAGRRGGRLGAPARHPRSLKAGKATRTEKDVPPECRVVLRQPTGEVFGLLAVAYRIPIRGRALRNQKIQAAVGHQSGGKRAVSHPRQGSPDCGTWYGAGSSPRSARRVSEVVPIVFEPGEFTQIRSSSGITHRHDFLVRASVPSIGGEETRLGPNSCTAVVTPGTSGRTPSARHVVGEAPAHDEEQQGEHASAGRTYI